MNDMSQLAFDTLKPARGLENAGFEHEQALKTAEAFADNISGTMVTREHFDHRMEALESQLQTNIAELRKDTKADIARLESEITRVPKG